MNATLITSIQIVHLYVKEFSTLLIESRFWNTFINFTFFTVLKLKEQNFAQYRPISYIFNILWVFFLLRTTSPGSQGKSTPEVATPNQSRSAALPEQSAASAISSKLQGVGDPSTWTIQEVVNYFTQSGFTEQASVFEEQVC